MPSETIETARETLVNPSSTASTSAAAPPPHTHTRLRSPPFLLLQSTPLCISFCRLLSSHVLFYSPSSLPPTHRLPYPPATTLQKNTSPAASASTLCPTSLFSTSSFSFSFYPISSSFSASVCPPFSVFPSSSIFLIHSTPHPLFHFLFYSTITFFLAILLLPFHIILLLLLLSFTFFSSSFYFFFSVFFVLFFCLFFFFVFSFFVLFHLTHTFFSFLLFPIFFAIHFPEDELKNVSFGTARVHFHAKIISTCLNFYGLSSLPPCHNSLFSFSPIFQPSLSSSSTFFFSFFLLNHHLFILTPTRDCERHAYTISSLKLTTTFFNAPIDNLIKSKIFFFFLFFACL
ncbi:unnamed protein product [Acanthosepion pharaonis]|uniref:Uncharacterized protein n=1 Tax=Acanthosepion pharaonis TaxID=158019 RepID=A0A812C681_ACAPH|nr:unnamed protein product [Sepia pharaonis]